MDTIFFGKPKEIEMLEELMINIKGMLLIDFNKYRRKKTKETIKEIIDSIEMDNIKYVVLNGFDMLTFLFQMSLRKIMDVFSRKVTFVLICYNPERIIESVRSKCNELDLKYYSKDQLIRVLVEGVE